MKTLFILTFYAYDAVDAKELFYGTWEDANLYKDQMMKDYCKDCSSSDCGVDLCTLEQYVEGNLVNFESLSDILKEN